MTDRKITFALALLLLPLLAVGARAQDPAMAAAERLQVLLHELGALDAKAWAARQAALEQQCKAIEQRAAELRAQAAKLQEQAAAADAEGKTVRAEMARLQELQKLLQGMTPAKVETPPAPPPPAATPAKVEEAAAKVEAPLALPAAAPPAAAAPASPAPAAAAPPPAAAAATSPLVTWRQVERTFQDHCIACHDPSEKKGGLDVSTFAGMTKGGGSGRTIVPGEPDQSRLWLLVSHQERPFMPKGEDALTPETQRLLRTWIEQGAAEDEASARAFLQAKATASKSMAAAAPNAADAPGALPENLPAQPLHVPARPAAIKCLARSPNAGLLALPGLQQVLLYDADWQPLGVLPCDLPHLETIGFSPDGSVLAVGGGEPGRRGTAALFDVRTGKALGTFGAERDVPLAVAVHWQRGLVALGGAGKRVAVLRTSDGSEAFLAVHDDFVLALAFSPDGALLAAADRTGVVRLWETDSGRLSETCNGHRGAVHALAFLRDGKMLVTAGADGTVRAWDPAEGKETWKRAAHDGEAFGLAIGEDSAVASCGSDGRIKLHSRAGKELAASPAAGEWLYAVAFGSSAGVVFGGDWLGRVHRFDVTSKAKEMAVTVPLAAAQ